MIRKRKKLRRQSQSSWASPVVRVGGQDLRLYPSGQPGCLARSPVKHSAGETSRPNLVFQFARGFGSIMRFKPVVGLFLRYKGEIMP